MDVEWEGAYVVCGHPILILMSIARSVTWTNANEEPDCVCLVNVSVSPFLCMRAIYDERYNALVCILFTLKWILDSHPHSFTQTHTAQQI